MRKGEVQRRERLGSGVTMWGGGQFRSLAPEAARTVTVVLRGTQSAFSERRVTGKYCGEGGGAV